MALLQSFEMFTNRVHVHGDVPLLAPLGRGRICPDDAHVPAIVQHFIPPPMIWSPASRQSEMFSEPPSSRYVPSKYLQPGGMTEPTGTNRQPAGINM